MPTLENLGDERASPEMEAALERIADSLELIQMHVKSSSESLAAIAAAQNKLTQSSATIASQTTS